MPDPMEAAYEAEPNAARGSDAEYCLVSDWILGRADVGELLTNLIAVATRDAIAARKSANTTTAGTP